ncbi:ATPase [Micromonospora acroterricola]|uniref:ATPase n=1 Tax=Micromonospora acroterricola TaxID=2202421 RepID=A0A317D9A6_9ACTN|nr:SRPBCC family protein [Micromonospora acroterricola]PWR11339.1 ATPase [Micromonospora acroterricola]
MDREAFRPSPPAEVRAEPSAAGATLVFVRDLRHPPATVWAALTDATQLAEWAPFLADRDLGAPGAAVLTMVDGETTTPTSATVRRAEPPTLLEYTWGDDLLRWELSALGTGTRLTLRHSVADRGMLAMVAAGWHLCLDVADRLLDGDPVGPIRGAEALDFGWPELRDTYADRFDES